MNNAALNKVSHLDTAKHQLTSHSNIEFSGSLALKISVVSYYLCCTNEIETTPSLVPTTVTWPVFSFIRK